MGQVPAMYVYAVDRKDVMEGRRDLIIAEADRHGTHPHIKIIKSRKDKDDSDGSANVRQDIARFVDEYHWAKHRVLIITHEAMMSADWAPYGAYHLIVDEVPCTWAHQESQTPALIQHFRAHYDLERVITKGKDDDVHTQVVAKPESVTLADYRRDSTLAQWATFHKRVTSRHGVFTNLLDFQEMEGQSKWSWWSRWDVRELASFSKVWIVGNAFEQSTTYRLIQSESPFEGADQEPVELIPLPETSTAHKWRERNVRIRFFARSHRAGASAWTTTGSPYVGHQHRWAEWVAANSPADGHYWTMNMDFRKQWLGKMPGVAVTPKVSGRNDLFDCTVCSVAYSAKASTAEIGAYRLFGVDADMIERSRQGEDLIQIVFRSSLRLPDDDRAVEIRVYDEEQAVFLKSYFEECGFAFNIDLEYVDIGLDAFVRKSLKEHRLDRALERCGSEEERLAAIARSKMTRAEKEAARKARIKAEKIAAGEVVRGRGRPKKGV